MPTPAEFAGRLLQHHRNRTAFGVAAEQGTLRTLEDFDALDIIEAGIEAVLAAEVDSVEVDPHPLLARGLVGIVGNDPADANR